MRTSSTSTKLLLAALLALAALAWPGTAIAQRCTQGYDIGLREDRNPSLCSFFTLSSGEAADPIASGPDGRLWFFVEDHGLYAAKMTISGQVERFAMPAGPTPNALTAGPDGNLWYAGDGRIGRLSAGGQVTEFPIPNLHATGIVTGPDGALWVAAGALVVKVTPSGEVSLIPLVNLPGTSGTGSGALPPLTTVLNASANKTVSQIASAAGGESHAITVGADKALWIAAGSHLDRVTTDGAVSRVNVPHDLPADGGITTAADGSLWYSSKGAQFSSHGSAVGRLDPASGQVQEFGVTGRPVDLVRGPGSANIWISTVTDSGRMSWITRMATRDFGPAKPRSWSCAGQNPAACWFRIQNVAVGDTRLFNTHATPGGIAVGPDGNVWYTEGHRIGRVMPFRGALPCYQWATAEHNFGCGVDSSHIAAVTHSGYAYMRTTCPYLTFRVCQGNVVLRTRRGRLVGSAPFILAAYDNPKVRVPLPRWMLDQIKRYGRQRVDAIYTSQDMGGIRKVTRGVWSLAYR